MVYSAKHREYQLVAKSTVPCFLTHVIFSMSIFHAPLCPRNWGAQRKFGGHAKKNFRREPDFVPPQLQNCVGAYAPPQGVGHHCSLFLGSRVFVPTTFNAERPSSAW